MKVQGHGKAKILPVPELQRLFSDGGLISPRDRALFGILFYCGCRVSEALSLKTSDIDDGVITLKKSITKGKIATRSVPIYPQLQRLLDEYKTKPGNLFPGRHGKGQMTRAGADKNLKEVCERLVIKGVSTHSFRRTNLTQMSSSGVPLRVIQEVSGHQSLAALQRSLEVQPEQVKAAISTVGF
ncbi:MAG: site-specific integrase [Crinalium sp.]